MPLILGANSVSGYTVKNSLRFNSGSSDYLNRTFSTNGTNRTIRTISCWVKRAKLGTSQVIIGGDDGSANQSRLVFLSGDTLNCRLGGASSNDNTTTAVFRDVSAWYHIVATIDTTQSTAANRVKIYVNGTQQTISSPSSTQNQTTAFANASSLNTIGQVGSLGSDYFDGYISEFYFIDGQALTPSSFGETDTLSGIWKPKAYTGTYGTNGFYLQFKNSASLGTDSSGNGNTFTVNNLTSVDQSTDTPTNNFCTLNNLDGGTNGTFTEGNLQLTTSSSGYSTTRASFGVSAGKWYWEAKLSSGTAADIGINTSSTDIANTNQFLGYPSTGYAYSTSGNKATNNTNTAYGSSYTTNDIIGVAFDADNGTLVFYKNGTTQGTAFTGLTGNTYHPAVSDDSGSSACTWQMNFGSPMYSANSYTDGAGYGNFSYAVPSGYYALNTKNLATFG